LVKVAEVSELKHAVETLLEANGMLAQFHDTDMERFRAEFYLWGFDPLLVEREDGKILVAHLRPLGDDIVMEPAARLTGEWYPLEFVQQRDGTKWTVARQNGKSITVLDPAMFGAAKRFCRDWGQDLDMQGWADDASVMEE
jgi:hypothetical protein